MPKNNGKHNDELFRETFREGFKKQYQNGLLAGSRAICKVVSDKASDETKTPEERIEDIKKFCRILAGLDKPLAVKHEESAEEPKDDQH